MSTRLVVSKPVPIKAATRRKTATPSPGSVAHPPAMLLPGSSDASRVLATITALAIKVVLLLGLLRTAVATTTAATGLMADMPLPVPQLVLPPGNSKLLPVVLLLLLLLLPLPLDMDMDHTPVMPTLPAWQLLV